MAFTGKATYSAGAGLPEIAEDVSDIISIVSPYETALLDHLGDPQRSATSTVHEWLEDTLLPNKDTVNDQSIGDPTGEVIFGVVNSDRFRTGDEITIEGSGEVMLVLAVIGAQVTVQRGYGSTTPEAVVDGATIHILGNAALEGADAPAVRFTNRVRKQNYTQIFTSSVEVSGSQIAAQTLGLADELDYQKQERLRELLRDLENCLINGVSAEATPEGDASTRRTMRGILGAIATNVFVPGVGAIPQGDGKNGELLTEAVLNAALRMVWEESSARIDTIVCGGMQKRRINEFTSASQRFADEAHFRQLIDSYESDFGICRVVMSRWVPSGRVLLLDSSRISVMPLSGRSFHYKELAATGDAVSGQLIGEYTTEFRNESAHAVIEGLG